ncbi:MAG TPA: M48 family metallopeptidase [Nitrospira sp.]|nr:M48 family metallopeptidase [Nitrospira sp.]
MINPNALCFGEGFPVTGAPCRVEVFSSGLTVHFQNDASALNQLNLPFSSVSVSAGGLDHDQLVVRWGAAREQQMLYLKDPALIRAFRSAAPPDLTKHLELTAATVRRARSRNRAIWASVIAAVGGLALALWLSGDLLAEWAVSRIPVQWEQRLGQSAYHDFLAQQTVIKEGPSVAAVLEISHRLLEHIPNNPYTFEVSVVKNDVVNAFALPGGYVVVFTGLLEHAKSGEEVAGVLGHEFSHVLQRHSLDRIVKQLGVVAVLGIIFGDQQGLTGVMKQVGAELLSLQFGRAQETEADVKGLQILHRAHVDPEGMIAFFQRMSESEQGRVEWLSSHPMSAARAERLKKETALLPKTVPEPFTFQWQTVQPSTEASTR